MKTPIRVQVFYPNLGMVEILAVSWRDRWAALLTQQIYEYVKGMSSRVVDYS